MQKCHKRAIGNKPAELGRLAPGVASPGAGAPAKFALELRPKPAE